MLDGDINKDIWLPIYDCLCVQHHMEWDDNYYYHTVYLC